MPVMPAPGADADAGLMLSDPVAPCWERVNVRLSMVSVAVRGETELLAAAVQERLLPEVDTMSQDGEPETVQPA